MPDPARHDGEVAPPSEPAAGPDPFAELREAFAHEQAVLERVLTAARAQHAERHAQLDTWAAELAERERLLADRTDELERQRVDLVEQRTEIVAEYTRAKELTADAGSRVVELESAERARVELERDRAVFEASRQQMEARLAARELAISERDAMVASRERTVAQREADFVTEARRLDQRQSALRAAEARLHDAEAELKSRRSSLEEVFEQREAELAEVEADVTLRLHPAPEPDNTIPFTTTA